MGALFSRFLFCSCSRFVGKSALSTHLFALENVVMSNYSLEKVCVSLNYSQVVVGIATANYWLSAASNSSPVPLSHSVTANCSPVPLSPYGQLP